MGVVVLVFAVIMIVPLFLRKSENFQLRTWLVVTIVPGIGLAAFVLLGTGGLIWRMFSR
jgi:hypothetical protein